ncbi:hypothetical protein [Streptomyces sp. 147326]|uniref:hypothetical protein n=1 Tax=Streptomyces sp. 147326 TaxID=3074379 RepID=UPI00385730FB
MTCAELLPYETRMAADAVYVTAGIQRRRGDLAAAEASYTRAHTLGRDPQPGLSGAGSGDSRTSRLAGAGGAEREVPKYGAPPSTPQTGPCPVRAPSER